MSVSAKEQEVRRSLPNKLSDRPLRGRIVVPFMVDESRDPIDFKALDEERLKQCAGQRRCGICGRKLKRGDTYAFIGPVRDLLCFDNPWMHEVCARYSARHCSFLGDGQRRYRDPADADDELLAPWLGELAIYLAPTGSVHRDALSWHFQPHGRVRQVRIEVAS